MQIYFGLFLLLSLMNLSWSQQVEKVIRNDFDGPFADGSYRWAFQTDGGIFHEQRGSLQKTQTSDQSLLVEGQYQYTAPDGQVINVVYKADENGFHAQGEHIPTPPPIPSAIQRALDYLATLHPTETAVYNRRQIIYGIQQKCQNTSSQRTTSLK